MPPSGAVVDRALGAVLAVHGMGVEHILLCEGVGRAFREVRQFYARVAWVQAQIRPGLGVDSEFLGAELFARRFQLG